MSDSDKRPFFAPPCGEPVKLRFEIGSLAFRRPMRRLHQCCPQPFVAVSGPPATPLSRAFIVPRQPSPPRKLSAPRWETAPYPPRFQRLSLPPSFFYAGDGHQILFDLPEGLDALVDLQIKLRDRFSQESNVLQVSFNHEAVVFPHIPGQRFGQFRHLFAQTPFSQLRQLFRVGFLVQQSFHYHPAGNPKNIRGYR